MSTPAPAQEAQSTYRKSPWAVGKRGIKAIIEDLSKPLHRRLLASKTVGGQNILFLPWHTAVKILDYKAPGWTFEITHMIHLHGRMAMTCRLTIPANENEDGTGGIVYYYRDASGTEIDEQDKYGDPVSNSESMCLRRAAAKFGLCLGLYGGANNQQGQQGSQGQGNRGSSASSPPITQKQLTYARTLAGERGIDENSISKNLFKKDLVDCTVGEANSVIEKLLASPKPQAAPAPPQQAQTDNSDDYWGSQAAF